MKLIAKNTVVFFLSLAIAVISFPKPNAGSPLISATTDASSAQVGVNDSNAETVAMSGFSGKTYCTENDTSDWVDSVNEFIRSSINTTQDDMMTHYTANTASDSSVASSPLDCSTDADGIPPYNDSVATTMVPSPEISTDMTASIVFMLKQYGVCHLNEGVYYVSGIDMPDDSMLIGSGAKTVIRLSDNGDYAIKMNKRNKVANMTIAGSSKAIALNETVGNRHGILWSVNYYDSNKPCYGILDGLWIKSFNGGGITCSNTGYGTTNFISATNINIMNCNAGINIAHWSEYHKFTNVRT